MAQIWVKTKKVAVPYGMVSEKVLLIEPVKPVTKDQILGYFVQIQVSVMDENASNSNHCDLVFEE
jgi:hypothetical protein